MANYMNRRQSRANKQVLGESINLLAKGKKKRQWKIKTAMENDEEAKDDGVYQRPPFDSDKIYQLISDVVDKTFVTDDEDEPYVYDANENVNLCQRISKDIRDTLKTWRQLMRYRIIALVSVVEKQHQGIHYKMKYVIDPKTDNFVKYYLDNPNFYVIVCVMLVFQD